VNIRRHSKGHLTDTHEEVEWAKKEPCCTVMLLLGFAGLGGPLLCTIKLSNPPMLKSRNSLIASKSHSLPMHTVASGWWHLVALLWKRPPAAVCSRLLKLHMCTFDAVLWDRVTTCCLHKVTLASVTACRTLLCVTLVPPWLANVAAEASSPVPGHKMCLPKVTLVLLNLQVK
jgi:hypothetical protein